MNSPGVKSDLIEKDARLLPSVIVENDEKNELRSEIETVQKKQKNDADDDVMLNIA